MMQGPIDRLLRHRIDQRDDVRLPTLWIDDPRAKATLPEGTWLRRSSSRLGRTADAPVLVMLRDGDHDALGEILTCAGTGTRVYALVGPGWGKGQSDGQLLKLPRLLVRRVPEVPVTAVQSGNDARVWIGEGAVLRLDGSQSESLRQIFLRLFWHEATEESWSGGRQLVWRPARERPFDVPEISSSGPVRWEGPDAQLLGGVRGALVHLTGGVPPEAAPKRLWYPAGPGHHDRLARLARAGVEVLWADRGLPDLLVAGEGGEVLLPGTKGRLRLLLTPDQASEVSRLLEAAPVWQFRTDVRLGDPGHRSSLLWLSGAVSALNLEVEQRIELPEMVALSLRELPETAPEPMPPAQPLALSVRYEWSVAPPRAPAGHEEDGLIGRWRRLDEGWIARLTQIRDALANSEGERGRISRKFTRLLSAVLGFQHTCKGLQADLAGLGAERPSQAGPTGAQALLLRLEKLEAAVAAHRGELEAAELKAKEDEERDKQKTAWQARVDTAKRSLPERREELSKAEGLVEKFLKDLQSLAEDLKSADKEARRDIQARQKKLTDDRHRAEKEVKQLRDEITSLERRVDEPFEFRSPAAAATSPVKSGGRFVPPPGTAVAKPQVPDEALPEVGLLRRFKGQRFLVIETWEQLALGEAASTRLSAKLVAPEKP